jgi:hypothetical protein
MARPTDIVCGLSNRWRGYQNPPLRNIVTATQIPIKIRKNPITNFELLESKGVSRLDRLLRDPKINSDPTSINAIIEYFRIGMSTIPGGLSHFNDFNRLLKGGTLNHPTESSYC